MPKLRIPFLLTCMWIIVLLGGLVSPFMAGSSGTSSWPNLPSAQAANLEDNNIYIPFATVYYPALNIYGVGMDEISPTGGLNALAQTHSSWVRRDGVRWNEVELVKGQRKWEVLSGLEAELRAAARTHQRVILIVQGTPDWAAKDKNTTCGPIKEGELATFASFMRELVARYSGYPYYVKDWEIWNEPDTDALDSLDGFGCWGDATDEYFGGGYYGQMLSTVYPAIKSADPHARVIVGGLLLDCHPNICITQLKSDKSSKFLEGILREGAGNSFDGISFHAYDYYRNGGYENINWGTSLSTSGPVSIAKAAYIRDLLSRYGVTGKFLMNTESALICGNGCLPPFETAKANYVPQAFAAAAANNFEVNLWYNMLGWRGSGLLDSNLNPRDAYRSFKFASIKLGVSVFSSKYEINNLEVYEFRRGNRRILVLWSKDGQDHPHGLAPVNMYNVFGEPIINQTIVGPSPVYIELNT